MVSSVPQAVQSCHELLLWLIPQLDKFPRTRRSTLGERLEMRLSRLRKDPSFILREPQDERSGHWNYWGFPFVLSPSTGSGQACRSTASPGRRPIGMSQK